MKLGVVGFPRKELLQTPLLHSAFIFTPAPSRQEERGAAAEPLDGMASTTYARKKALVAFIIELGFTLGLPKGGWYSGSSPCLAPKA
jgi:hypothetical protein